MDTTQRCAASPKATRIDHVRRHLETIKRLPNQVSVQQQKVSRVDMCANYEFRLCSYMVQDSGMIHAELTLCLPRRPERYINPPWAPRLTKWIPYGSSDHVWFSLFVRKVARPPTVTGHLPSPMDTRYIINGDPDDDGFEPPPVEREKPVLETALKEFCKHERTIDRIWLWDHLWSYLGYHTESDDFELRQRQSLKTHEEMFSFLVDHVLPTWKNDQVEQKNTQIHDLGLTLSSCQPLEVSHIERIRHGPMAGYHALYIKTFPQFSKFLELSREIRNMIYTFVMKRDSKIFINKAGRRGVINKQVHDEAIEILYEKNFFTTNCAHLETFVTRLGGNAHACIRHLELWMDDEALVAEDPSTHLALHSDSLAKLPHLKELRLVFQIEPCFNYYRIFAAKLFFRQARRELAEVAQLRGQGYDVLKLITADSILERGLWVREENLKVIKGSFQADLGKFINDPALALWDELDDFADPRKWVKGKQIPWEVSRWEALEHFRTYGSFPQMNGFN
ncbi:hypothetical protein IWZ01DRAFT_479079 [Phyllosticta capitalensis]